MNNSATPTPTCSTCRWWSTPLRHEPYLRYCNRAGHGDLEATPADFQVYEGEPYNSGTFATGPSFGCIHHEHATP